MNNGNKQALRLNATKRYYLRSFGPSENNPPPNEENESVSPLC